MRLIGKLLEQQSRPTSGFVPFIPFVYLLSFVSLLLFFLFEAILAPFFPILRLADTRKADAEACAYAGEKSEGWYCAIAVRSEAAISRVIALFYHVNLFFLLLPVHRSSRPTRGEGDYYS